MLRFRVLDLAAGLALLICNLLIQVWPMVGLAAEVDETVGVVVVRRVGDVAPVRLDYVTRCFHDFTPGDCAGRTAT